MSRELLERAQNLIVRKEYDAARAILTPLADRSTTARRWLTNLNQLTASTTDTAPAVDATEAPASEPSAEPSVADATPADELSTDTLIPPEAGESLMTKAEAEAVLGVRWEYREIVLKTWQQHMSNIEYALSQGGEKTTIEDAYTHMLNENGANGWEVISEEVLPQQYVRLLLKRPVPRD